MAKIIIIAHRPLSAPGGGEASMKIIAEHLASKGHSVIVQHPGYYHESPQNGVNYVGMKADILVEISDVVISWGRPALEAFNLAEKHGKPFINCVRWWRNLIDITGQIGNMMERHADHVTEERRGMFARSAAVITNNRYSAAVIERLYGREAVVSYVPILGPPNPISRKDGHIVAVSPDKGLDEHTRLKDIITHFGQDTRFLIVNPAEGQNWKMNNVTTMPYTQDMTKVWREAKMLIQPIYENDICGTLRVTIEAMRHGVPVVANDRSGMSEKVPNLVSYNATTREWVDKISVMGVKWERYSAEALEVFGRYDTPAQLRIFEKEIEKATSI